MPTWSRPSAPLNWARRLSGQSSSLWLFSCKVRRDQLGNEKPSFGRQYKGSPGQEKNPQIIIIYLCKCIGCCKLADGARIDTAGLCSLAGPYLTYSNGHATRLHRLAESILGLLQHYKFGLCASYMEINERGLSRGTEARGEMEKKEGKSAWRDQGTRNMYRRDIRGKREAGTRENRRAGRIHSQSTYICRVQSCVWRLPKY
jgi:hypothetical protein